MSVYVAVGGVVIDQFSTNRGMGDFTRWVDRLDEIRFPSLVHLVDWGWVNDRLGLRAELDLALITSQPKQSIRTVVRGLITAIELNNGETVVLTNGTSPIGGTGEWETGVVEAVT